MTQDLILKENISFIDADNNLVNCELEIKQTSKGMEFSMSGSYDSSCGQIFNSINPRTKTQKRLIELWNKYHLNGMNAGTIEQEKLLKKCKSNDYDKQVEYLKKHKLYTVTLEDGTKYKYGTSWLYRPLPNNFKEELTQLLKNIKIENEEYKQKKKLEELLEELDKQLEE